MAYGLAKRIENSDGSVIIMSSEVKRFYENYEEGKRLSRDNAHKIEFLTTVHYLDKFLPKGSRILDACAGEGDYAFYLADRGYKVIACDLTPKHIDSIKANPQANKLVGAEVANVLDLSRFDDGSFDVVLCMGALYHLFDPTEREKCIAECLRVLKSGGIFAFAYINRYGVFMSEFYRQRIPLDILTEMTKTGRIDVFYCMDFEEAQTLASKFPLDKIADVNIDGLNYILTERLNAATDEEFAAYMEYHLATCEQPAILSFGSHGLWIGKKY